MIYLKTLLVVILSYFLYLPALAANCKATTPSDSSIVNFLQDEYHVKFTNNNRIVVFKTGKEKFDDLFPAIRAAKESIHLEYFNFRNDSISKELFTLLVHKAAEGVKVRALFDGFGNSSNNRPLRRRHLDSLRARGIEIYEFDPIRFPYLNHIAHRDHRKIGKEMELFMFSDLVGKGLPMWLPKGTALRLRLEDFLKKIQKRYGYQQVMTPHIGSKNLYVTSGHYAKYGKDSFQPIHTPEEGEDTCSNP